MRDEIVKIAISQMGVTEFPKDSNNTKYGEWFGLNGVAWCGIFVSWVYAQAKCPLGTIDYLKGYAGCPFAMKHFIDKGQVTKTPKPGDIVFYDWNGDKKSDHTGIFVGWIDGRTFEAIEGNTSMGNDSNGGKVMKRVRDVRYVQCFVSVL